MLGTLIVWNATTEVGIIRDSLSESMYTFRYGHKEDREHFRRGLRVVFEATGSLALNVQAASGAFQRFANHYTPD